MNRRWRGGGSTQAPQEATWCFGTKLFGVSNSLVPLSSQTIDRGSRINTFRVAFPLITLVMIQGGTEALMRLERHGYFKQSEKTEPDRLDAQEKRDEQALLCCDGRLCGHLKRERDLFCAPNSWSEAADHLSGQVQQVTGRNACLPSNQFGATGGIVGRNLQFENARKVASKDTDDLRVARLRLRLLFPTHRLSEAPAAPKPLGWPEPTSPPPACSRSAPGPTQPESTAPLSGGPPRRSSTAS